LIRSVDHNSPNGGNAGKRGRPAGRKVACG
jgi:hypothetical protein